MKSRRVTLTLEIDSPFSVADLRRTRAASLSTESGTTIGDVTVLQAQANVIQTPTGTVNKARRRARKTARKRVAR